MSLFKSKPVVATQQAPFATVNQFIPQIQKQADDLLKLEDSLEDEIDFQRDLIASAQAKISRNQIEIDKSRLVRESLLNAIQAS